VKYNLASFEQINNMINESMVAFNTFSYNDLIGLLENLMKFPNLLENNLTSSNIEVFESKILIQLLTMDILNLKRVFIISNEIKTSAFFNQSIISTLNSRVNEIPKEVSYKFSIQFRISWIS